jgi:amidase
LPPPRHDRLTDFRVLVIDRHPLCPTEVAVSAAHTRLAVAQGGRVITIQADVADPDAVAQQSIASSREYAGANVEIRRVLTQTQALDHPIFCQNR